MTSIRSLRRRWLSVFVVPSALAAGCGEKAPPAPQQQIGTVEPGAGTTASATTSTATTTTPTASTPTTTPPTPAAPVVRGSDTPATLKEVIATLDLRTFPRLEGATKIQAFQGPIGSLTYEAPGTATTASDFYIQQFESAGWKEHFSGEKRSFIQQDGNEYISLTFTKNDFIANLSFSSETKKPGVNVSVHNLTNFRAGSLPQLKPIQEPPLPPSTFPNYTFAMYTTDATEQEAVGFTRKELAAKGWREFSDRFERPVPANATTLHFANKAIHLTVMIGKAPAKGNKVTVQYHCSILATDAPTTSDATDLRIESLFQYKLRFESKLSFDDVVAFYKKELPALGWKYRDNTGMFDKKHTFFFFDAANGESLSFDLKPLDGGKTQVQFVLYPPKPEKEKDKEKTPKTK